MSDIKAPLPGNPLDNAGLVKQTVAMLFYGWGYNWYRKENQLRADDLLIRSKVSDYLQQARASLALLENSYRDRYLQSPTREHPFADPAVLAQVRSFHELAGSVSDVETQVRTAPVPGNDKIWQKYRIEKDVLQQLCQADAEMVDIAISLNERVSKVTMEEGLESWFASEIKGTLDQFKQVFRRRLALLQI